MDFTPLAYANFKSVLEKYNVRISIEEILTRYNERHRFFHTPEHLNRIMKDISKGEVKQEIDPSMMDELLLTTIFHDIVYIPWKKDNEEKSASIFTNVFPSSHSELREAVIKNILATKEHIATSEIQKIFNRLDFGELINHDAVDFQLQIHYEYQLFRENQFIDIDTYIKNRIAFLQSIDNPTSLVLRLIEYVKNRHYNIGIYPGSFNPFHKGHMNILEKAEKLFDKVIIVKAVNPEKNVSVSELKEQMRDLKKQIPDRETLFIEGNIIEQMFVNDKRNPILIRGLRNGYDLMHEENYLTICKDFHPTLRYSLILCDKEFSHISSTVIRSIGATSKVGKKYTVPCYMKD